MREASAQKYFSIRLPVKFILRPGFEEEAVRCVCFDGAAVACSKWGYNLRIPDYFSRGWIPQGGQHPPRSAESKLDLHAESQLDWTGWPSGVEITGPCSGTTKSQSGHCHYNAKTLSE